MNALVAPTVLDCDVSTDLASLVMKTPDERRVTLSAEQLRLSCKCAHCTRARFEGRLSARCPGIAIVAVTDLGSGLNIAFSDGHSRGIYPRSYLADLAAL